MQYSYDYFLKNVAKFKHVLDTYWIKTVQCIFLGFTPREKSFEKYGKKIRARREGGLV